MNLRFKYDNCCLVDKNNGQSYSRVIIDNIIYWCGFYNHGWEEITDPLFKDLLEYEYRQAKLNEI